MADTTIADALLLITKVSSSTEKRLSLIEKVVGKTASSTPSYKTPRQVVEKAKPVIVTAYGRKAAQYLRTLQDKNDSGGDKPGGKTDGAGFIKKLIGPALLVLGGVAALVTGLMTDGPLKGFLSILSKGGIIGGIKLFQRSMSKQLGKFGTLFAKILPKDLFGSVVTKAKGFLGKIGKFLLAPFKKIAGKGGSKALFGTIGKLFSKTLKPLLKRIPGIGSLISWGFAVSRFKKGDLVGGLIDVASGLATLFPGIGTGISIGLDVLNAFLDVKKGKPDDAVKPAGSGFKLSSMFGKIKDKIMNNFPIKNLVNFWGGAGKIMTGDFKGGFSQMASTIPFMKPLADFLFDSKDEGAIEGASNKGNDMGSMFMKIKDKLLIKILNFLPSSILGVSVRARAAKLVGIDLGAIQDDPEMVANSIKAEIQEERERVTRSENGDNEYWGREGKGRSESLERIAELEAKLTKLNPVQLPDKAIPSKQQDKLHDIKCRCLDTPDTPQDKLSNIKSTVAGIDNVPDKSIHDYQLKAVKEQTKTLNSLSNTNKSLLEAQISILHESAAILKEIAAKTGLSANIVTNNTTAVTNMNNQRSLRDVQEMYA
jgi:hypothetical protein